MQGGDDLRTVVLPDGRQLAFAEHGNPAGPAWVFMHGWPGSRLCGRWLAGHAADLGIRLLVPDRPGMGQSDPLPGRTLLDGARDTALLADRLGLDRFAVAGYSGGGPYALACAFLFPERLTHAVVMSGLAPLDTRRALSLLPPHLRAAFSLARVAPGFARVPAGIIALGVRRLPELVVLQACLSASVEDRRVLARRPVFEAFRAEYREAFRQGAGGVADEVRLFARPWGFPPGEITAAVGLVHGEQDRFVPSGMGRLLAEALPGARLRLLPEAGHFWIVDRFARVLREVLEEGA